MPRHLSLIAAAVMVASNATPAAAADFANPYATLPRCPDDAAASAAKPKPLGPALTVDEPYEVVSGAVTGDADKNLEVQGRIEIRQGDKQLSAERGSLKANRINVDGKIEYRDPQLVVRGNAGSFADGEASFEGANFELPLQPARGSARSMSVNRAGILRLEGVNYTTCPENQPDWQIRADSVSLDTDKSMGTARDARVEFMGVPILRLPAISFPIGDARKTGLLFPSLGSSSSSGVQLSVPYYFNLAPNQDLTLTPTYYSKRGLDIETEYRFLTRSSRGEILANLLPRDRRYDHTRNRLKLTDVTELPGNWRLSLNAENVSDAQYFEDFSQGADGASIAYLPRRVQLSYRSIHLDAGVLLRNFQTLDQQLPQKDRPYTELPRIYARGSWTLSGSTPLVYGFDSEATAFRHGTEPEGWRFDVAPQIALNYEGAGYFFKPALALETTRYRLSDANPGADRSPSRTLPIASIDGGLLFERSAGKRSLRRVTLEPRLMYLYVPYREQSNLPVFDTAEPDLNWIELFRTNRYVGADRVSDANQLSAGLTTHLYSANGGTRFLSTTLGQTFYFTMPRVRLPDEAPVTGDTSDFIAQVELQAFKNWNVSMGVQWDHQDSLTKRSEVHVRYQPAPQSVVNLGYRFQRDRLEQADISAAWPVADNWRVYGRALYSLRDKQSIEHFAGFEYSSCCWSVRAVARDYVGRRSGERDRSYYLQLELKGLSNVGLAADAFLERAIRGYSPDKRRH
jgi:LPS-assembly protein